MSLPIGVAPKRRTERHELHGALAPEPAPAPEPSDKGSVLQAHAGNSAIAGAIDEGYAPPSRASTAPAMQAAYGNDAVARVMKKGDLDAPSPRWPGAIPVAASGETRDMGQRIRTETPDSALHPGSAAAQLRLSLVATKETKAEAALGLGTAEPVPSASGPPISDTASAATADQAAVSEPASPPVASDLGATPPSPEPPAQPASSLPTMAPAVPTAETTSAGPGTGSAAVTSGTRAAQAAPSEAPASPVRRTGPPDGEGAALPAVAATVIDTPAATPVTGRELPPAEAEEAIDLDRVAIAAPELGPSIAQLQSIVEQKKSEILNAASGTNDAIRTQAAARREEAIQAADQLAGRIGSVVTQSRAAVSSRIRDQRSAVEQGLIQQKDAAHQAIAADAGRLESEAARLSATVTDAAREKTAAAQALGPEQANRARTEVGKQAAEARRRGERKVASIVDADPERAQSQQYAVRQVAAGQAVEIERTAPEIARFAQERASEIAVNFTGQAAQIVAEIRRSVPGSQIAVLGLSGIADTRMDRIAQTVLGSLTQLEQKILGELDALQSDLAPEKRTPC